MKSYLTASHIFLELVLYVVAVPQILELYDACNYGTDESKITVTEYVFIVVIKTFV